MESALAGAVLKSVMGKLFQVLDKEYNKQRGLGQEVESIMADLRMIAAAMDDRRMRSSVVERLYSEEMLDLAHDVEDSMDRFIHRLTCKKRGELPIYRELKKIQSRSSFADEIKKLKGRLDEARKRVIDVRLPATTTAATSYTCDGGGQGQPTGSTPSSGVHNPVGIVKPVEELISLLDEVASEPEQLRVISIVGFGGLGKTTLARAVYNNHRAQEKFHCRAWVTAGRSPEINSDGVKGILRHILRQVRPKDTMDVDLDGPYLDLEALLTEYLKDKRYLIVIDDIGMEQWSTINSIFKNNGTSSRILLTTTIQSVANRCSHVNGYVYQLNTLGEEDSKKVALNGVRSPELELGSEVLLKKCDGLPLALVSVSNFLMSSPEPTGELCVKLCRNLGSHMKEKHGHDNFTELRKVLLDNYDSLSGYAMACVLYLGIFPNDRPLKRKVVTRRWLAEGYARSNSSGSEEDIAYENFNMLVDRSIIRPIDVTNSAQVKTCRTHGIMHEFLLQRSNAQRFIAASSCDHPRSSFDANNARHLSIHGGGAMHGGESVDNLSRVRSLSVFGDAANAISYVRKCKLLRVLDLELCNDLEDHHIKHIDKLWHLKYLSLGGTVRNLPTSIEGLHCLETLDLRRTNINTLPIQAIELPHLAHLFGKFMLDKNDLKKAKRITRLQKFLLEKSNLQTLAGFAVEGSQGLLHFIGQMKNLRKVKIWCQVDANGSNYLTDLSKAIQEFTKMPMDRMTDRSLSVDSEQCPEGWLSSLDLEQCSEGSKYYLRSLKLHGKLVQLPSFVKLLSGLTELCISSSATLTQGLLSSLLKLDTLLYLKLVANRLDDFKITRGAFPSLRRLCFVVQSFTSALPTIEQGSLPNLVSLQLLCRGLVGLSGIGIRHLRNLKEVALDSGVNDQTRQDWEGAAKNHPNRPRLVLLKGVDSVESEGPGQGGSSTAEERGECEPSRDEKVDRIESNEPVLSFVSEKRKECEASLDDELDPVQILQLKKMKLSESSSRIQVIVPQSVLVVSSTPASSSTQQ